DDAIMLFDVSGEFYARFAVLGDRATKLGSAITNTVGAYNAFASSLESRVLGTARKLQRVDQSRILEPVNMSAPEKADVRELT
ncbi:DNA recombination protein RmuC, partial [Bifidobacterium pseudocatenulatum]|nr:DNA recombination protein RmuC [Bifidobacterium pseudocatenulatum]